MPQFRFIGQARLESGAEFIATDIDALSPIEKMRSDIALWDINDVADFSIAGRHSDRVGDFNG
jgi:hypothetical protein